MSRSALPLALQELFVVQVLIKKVKLRYCADYWINNKIDFHTHSTAPYNAGFVLNGYIYQLAGYTRNSRKLYILDYVNKKTIADITWKNSIINNQEQEQCSRYKDGILINYNLSDKLVYVKFNNWSF